MKQASDGFHQIGLTRMGRNPNDSVVDADCRVHGVDNLHIASSSVFPSGSQANHTFVAVALAFRLAARLAERAAPPSVPDTAGCGALNSLQPASANLGASAG